MVDLKGQYEDIKQEVDTSVIDVIESTAFINGPKVHEFQKNLETYLDVKHVIPCANGTDALQIAMMGLGLKPGDEVITADFTFAATVEVIALLGLTPVLVDVEPDLVKVGDWLGDAEGILRDCAFKAVDVDVAARYRLAVHVAQAALIQGEVLVDEVLVGPGVHAPNRGPAFGGKDGAADDERAARAPSETS